MPRRDWPVPARMGFAVNRSQLVQSEWKETAQKGYFVSATVCEAGGKNKTQSLVLSSHHTGPYQILRGQINLGFRPVVALLCWHMLQHGGYIVTAFNVAVDVNIAFCVAFVFLNSIQWPELLPDTNVSSRAFQIAHKHSRNLPSRLQSLWNVRAAKYEPQKTDAESHLENKTMDWNCENLKPCRKQTIRHSNALKKHKVTWKMA